MKIKLTFISATLLAICQNTLAAAPTVGGIPLIQIPPAPSQTNEPPKLDVEKRESLTSPTAIDNKKIRVNDIKIQGNQIYSEAELLAVAEFVPGTDLSLTDLRSMTVKMSDFYREHGYFLAQAYLPPQNIQNGVITISVIVGQYGKISVNNQTRLSNAIVDNLMSDVNKGALIESGALETDLLLLSDVPGVKVQSTLVPGSEAGTSDLNVNLTPGPLVTGSVDADNAGLPYTGRYRLGATVNLNNLAGLGDVASLRVLTSGSGMNYGRASYQIQAGRTTVGVAYTQLGYELGKEYADLGIHGSAKIGTLYGSYPLIRSRDTNLYTQLSFESRYYQDKIDSINSETNKHANVLMAGISGDHRDYLGGGGLSSYGLLLSMGNLDIESPEAKSIDSTSAKANGNYAKLAFNAMRLQNIMDSPVSLYGSLNGQVASKNLDIWEKMELGGMYGVRAYPAGTAFGDQGYLLNLEARLLLPKLTDSMPGRVHLIALYDTGSVNHNKNNWGSTNNTVRLSGVGGGFTWLDPNNFSVKGYYAHKVGSTPANVNSSASGQFWIQLVKYF